MRRLALALLGSFEARLGGGPVLTFPAQTAESLLADLALLRSDPPVMDDTPPGIRRQRSEPE